MCITDTAELNKCAMNYIIKNLVLSSFQHLYIEPIRKLQQIKIFKTNMIS